MKNIFAIISFALALIFLCSCTETDCLEGNSNLVYIPYSDLGEYNKIVLNLPGAIIFNNAVSDTNLLLTVDDNLQNEVSIRVENGTLFIESANDRDICPSRLRFNINKTQMINSFEMNGSGSFFVEDSLSIDSFDGIINGSGKIELEYVEADNLSYAINGSGEISNAGICQNLEISINGSGEYNMFDLESTICDASIIGNGTIDIFVIDELNAEIIGSGLIRYQGDPVTVNTNIEGSGRIEKYEQ